MEELKIIQEIISELLDIEVNEIKADTYLIRQLNAESIDLLEIAVTISHRFNIEVMDDIIFLRQLRSELEQAKINGITELEWLKKVYSHLSDKRLNDILQDLGEGPVLKVKDLVSYIIYQKQQ